MTLTVCPVRTVADLEAVATIEAEVFGPLGYPFFLLRQWHDAMPELLLLATDDGAPVGEAVGALAAGHADAWIYGLAVRPAAQGRGVGRRLLDDVIARAAALGATSVWLHVAPDNPAVRLYERAGFAVVRRSPDHFGPHHDRLIMRRAAASARSPS